MIQEALEYLNQQAVQAANAEIIQLEVEPNHVYAIRNRENGELKWREAAPATRSHTAFDLSAVIDFAKRFHTPDSPCAVWYSRNAVKCVINEEESRRDHITLPLKPSVPMAKLMELETRSLVIPQAAAVLMLRTTFYNCVPEAFVATIRRLKFRTNDAGSGVVEHGRSSVGRTLESEITGEGALPEYVVFSVPVFHSGFRVDYNVTCALEPIPGQGAFQFIPLPGEIETAFANAEESINVALNTELKESGALIYYGQA